MHISKLKSFRAHPTARRQRRQISKAQNTIGSAEAHKNGAKLDLNIASDRAAPEPSTTLENDIDVAAPSGAYDTRFEAVGQDADLDRFLDELPKAVRLAVMNPALIPGETHAGYFGLMRILAAELKPNGMVAWLWLKDFTDNQWSILRYLHAEQHILVNVDTQAQYSLIQRKLDKRGIEKWDHDLKTHWNLGIEKLVRYMGVDDTAVDNKHMIGEAFVIRITELERVTRLRAHAEFRRDIALRELEDRRDCQTAQRLREAVRKVEANASVFGAKDVPHTPARSPKAN